MKINKSYLRGAAAILVVIALFNVLAFVIPFKHTGVFWNAYVFGMAAILIQLPAMYYAFGDGKSAKSKFYGFPIARVAALYLIAQLVLSFAAMIIAKWLPTWISTVLFVVLLGIAALGFISTSAVRDEIERQDDKLKTDVSKMRALCSLGASLPAQCEDALLRQEAERFAQQLRYSDPVSSAATAEAESELATLTDELQRAILEGDVSGGIGLCKRAEAALAERNRLCKLKK